MNKKVLLTIGGVINSIFVLFHIVLGYMIHINPAISPADRPLMEMLNAGGLLMIFFLAYASLAYKDEVLNTKLGRLVILLSLTVYWSRAVEEVIIAPQYSIAIFFSCVITGLVYFLILIPSKVSLEEPKKVYS